MVGLAVRHKLVLRAACNSLIDRKMDKVRKWLNPHDDNTSKTLYARLGSLGQDVYLVYLRAFDPIIFERFYADSIKRMLNVFEALNKAQPDKIYVRSILKLLKTLAHPLGRVW